MNVRVTRKMKLIILDRLPVIAGGHSRLWSPFEVDPIGDLAVLGPYIGCLGPIFMLQGHSHLGSLGALNLRRQNKDISDLNSVLVQVRFDLIGSGRLFQSGN